MLLTFRVNSRPSINFCQLFMQLGNVLKISSTFSAAARHSVNFCQHSMQPGDLSNSVNFPCGQMISRQLTVLLGDLPLTSVNFSCDQETFCQFLSTIHAAGSFLPTSVCFSCGRETFHQFS